MSRVRSRAADATRARILTAAKGLFVRHGIDAVTIARIARKAGVSVPTVYSVYRSKEGILRALMTAALFGERFESARAKLRGVTDPVKLIALTPQVARAVYEAERSELGLLRGATAFSPALRKLEQEFEKIRLDMQEERVRLLFAQSKEKQGLGFDEARQILWMYTSRDVYRMLVLESGWTPDRYQDWLSDTLVNALASQVEGDRPIRGRIRRRFPARRSHG